MNLILQAAAVAKAAHAGQTRKNSDELYVNHCGRVASRVSLLRATDEECVAASWCHDIIEDCEGWDAAKLKDELLEWGRTEDEDSALFDMLESSVNDVVSLVLQLTDPSTEFPELPRKERKQMDREHLAQVSAAAKTIKLADRIDNLRDGRLTGGVNLSVYVPESVLLLEVLRGTNSELEAELEVEINKADALVRRAKAASRKIFD